MKILLKSFSLILFTLASCKDRKPVIEASKEPKSTRYAMVTGLKPEKIEYYKKLHAAAWPGVLKKISECHIRNFSIYMKKIDNSYFLFSYFEYTGTDFNADMNKMAADSTTRRWWKETDPCQLPLPDAVSKGEIWSGMDELFHEN